MTLGEVRKLVALAYQEADEEETDRDSAQLIRRLAACIEEFMDGGIIA